MLLAHLSDLHVRPKGEKLYDFVDTNGLLARHVARLNSHPEKPDAVVITGDITNCGTVAEYRMAKRILSKLDMPLFLLPGNHDCNQSFLEIFADDHPYLGNDPELICFTIESYVVRLVFLDTSIDGELHGNLGRKKLTWLAETLTQQPDKLTALFLHHHPMKCGCLHMDTIHCRDGLELLELLTQFPHVRHIFCGHTHRAIFQQYRNLLIVTAPSSAHQVPFNTSNPDGFYNLEPPAMLMHRFHPSTGLVSYVESLDLYHGPFRFDCTPLCSEDMEG